MRSLLAAVATVVLLCAGSLDAALHPKVALGAACAAPPTPTVTFVKSCTAIDVSNAACWTPRVPTSSDVVEFPDGTNAAMPFALTYTPLSVQSVYVAPGAVVTLNGGAIAVSSCLTVMGTLSLHNRVLDNGTASTIPFAADPSVPLGTDCSVVHAGFTPRVCGPGQVYVNGTLTLEGLYASLWAPTTVAAGAKLNAMRESFIWGTVSNYGTLVGDSYIYLHGSITNVGTASFQQVRADFWTRDPVSTNNSVQIVNSGALTFSPPKKALVFNYVSTRGWIEPYPKNDWAPIVALRIINSGQLTFVAPRAAQYAPWWTTYGISSFSIENHGTTKWSGSQAYEGVGLPGYPSPLGTGAVVNYGVLVADTAVVSIDVVSEGGTLQTINNGRFNLGMSEKRRGALRASGYLVSRTPEVRLRNTRVESRDGSGSVSVLAPMTLHGRLTVAAGATLVNAVREGAVRHLVTRGSSGTVSIAGKYVTGALEVLFSGERAVNGELLPSGTMDVLEGETAVLRSDTKLRVAAGAVVRVAGSLVTKQAEPAGGQSRRSGLHISPLSFVVGQDHVTGDFEIPCAPLDA